MSSNPERAVKRVRLLIADDHDTVRDSIDGLIREDDSLELVASAADAGEAVAMAGQFKPDVALVDVGISGGGGVRAAMGIRWASPLTKVLALSAHSDRDTVSRMLQAGALGYLVKGSQPVDVLHGIHEAAEGRGVISSEAAGDVPTGLTEEIKKEQGLRGRWHRRVDRIRQAIEGAGLSAVYQPIFDLQHRAIVGVEALARFDHPGPGRSPDYWFAEAEELDLLQELELAAIRTAVATAGVIPAPAFLSVNLSPATLLSGAIDGITPDAFRGRLVVEITEHAPVADYGALAKSLVGLRRAGGRLAVDDVGSGLASLRHILRLAPEIVKLDITITRGIDQDIGIQALVAAFIAYANKTGAMVVAEGIETEEELRTLIELGASHGQGYLFSRPMPATELAGYFADAGHPAAAAVERA